MDLQVDATPVGQLRRSAGRPSRSDPFAIGALGAVVGEVPKRSNGADCKSAGYAFGGSNPPLSTRRARDGNWIASAGIAQLARARAFQARGRGFEPRFPLHGQDPGKPPDGEAGEHSEAESKIRGRAGIREAGLAHVAQVVEHVLGKDEVSGSSPLVSSSK